MRAVWKLLTLFLKDFYEPKSGLDYVQFNIKNSEPLTFIACLKKESRRLLFFFFFLSPLHTSIFDTRGCCFKQEILELFISQKKNWMVRSLPYISQLVCKVHVKSKMTKSLCLVIKFLCGPLVVMSGTKTAAATSSSTTCQYLLSKNLLNLYNIIIIII